MKLSSSALSATAAAFLSITLTACATGPAQRHDVHGSNAGGAAPAHAKHGEMGMPGSGMMGSDMASMCGMDPKMMSKTPDQRRALMAEQTKSMSPEMMQKQMAMMREHMKMMQERMTMMQQQMGSQMPMK